MNIDDHAEAIFKHADAIRALIRPNFLLGLLCVDEQGRPCVVAPDFLTDAVREALAGSRIMVQRTPESP